MFDSILNFFRNRNNPTKEWPVQPHLPLVYNMRYKTLNDVYIASPLTEARRFGRCNFANKFGEAYLDLIYADLGFVLEYENDKLWNVKVIMSDNAWDADTNKIKPTSLSVINMSGRYYQLTSRTSLEEIHQCFGEPAEPDDMDEEDEEGELTLIFETGGNLVEVCFDTLNNELLSVEICEEDDE